MLKLVPFSSMLGGAKYAMVFTTLKRFLLTWIFKIDQFKRSSTCSRTKIYFKIIKINRQKINKKNRVKGKRKEFVERHQVFLKTWKRN